MPETKIYTVDVEIAPSHKREILEFINKNYLETKKDAFTDVDMRGDHLYFTAHEPEKQGTILVEVISTNPLQLILTPHDASPEFMDVIKEDLFFLVQFFEDNLRHSTLYFAWIEGKEVIPEEPPSTRKRMGDRLFSSNMILIYILFFLVNVALFLTLGLVYAVAAIIIFQLTIVLVSDRLFLLRNKWRITPENPMVHIIEYQLPVKEYEEFQEKFGKETITRMKKEIYDKTLAVGKEPTCQIGEDVMEYYGFLCNPESRINKVIDVYSLVKKATDIFDLPVPKIVISNTMVPNAAATGPSPSRGLVLITTGLLVQLEEAEILSVLGHELGHLQGRDPLVLFSIISLEFILRFTLFLPLVLINPIIYIILAFLVIFFIGKFFETRADLVSAMKIGQPEVLASALRKIGYARLQMERSSPTRIPSWLSFDTHPPIYFRVDRLEGMKTVPHVKNPLIQSIKDVFGGLLGSFGLRKRE
jgi:heat shock protein HtpX